MDTPQDIVYKFGGFRFESSRLSLFYNNELITDISSMPLKILSVLLQYGNQVVTYDEIIDGAWKTEKKTNKDGSNIKPHITALRKVLSRYEPDNQYIENFNDRGYRFVGADIEPVDSGETPSGNDQDEKVALPGEAAASGPAVDVASMPDPQLLNSTQGLEIQQAGSPAAQLVQISRPPRNLKKIYVVAASGIILLLAIYGAFLLYPRSDTKEGPQMPSSAGRTKINLPHDEDEIKSVILESQNFETLKIYTDPQNFDEKLLDKYFIKTETGGQEPEKIKGSVNNLLRQDLHYGSDSRLEHLDFTSVNIYSPGDYAEAQTDESWYIPSFHSDGTRDTTKPTRYPSKPTYYLKKINGKWLIELNTTARKKSD